MENDEEIKGVKNFIDQNNFFKNKKNAISTLNLIGSVVYARTNLLHNFVKLINLIDDINITNTSFFSDLEDNETIRRNLITKIIFSLSKYKNLNLCYGNTWAIDPVKYCNQYCYSSYANFETIRKMPDDKKIELTNPFHSASPIVLSMIYDNIDLLPDLISKYNYDINQKIPYSLFEMHNVLINSLPLEYSAFLGAINCFKFLLMKIENINYSRLLEFAFAGGNIDIIHIIENESHDQSIKSNQKLLYLAILYMSI